MRRCLGGTCATKEAGGDDELARLRSEVSRLHGQGGYADAIPVAEQYVSLARQKHGEEHREFATATSWLAELLRDQGRYPEAEPLFKRSLAVRENVLGAEHPDVATSLNDLAELLRAQARYREAEPLYKRSRAINEKELAC